ncbi:hypothetical protein [Embleya sp. NPDC050493]|uniref:hypothetical protein n=1 Tax=Embleya sp. NPDC050493 TaxID=3363989 RepID=UPI00379D7485
MMPVAPTMVAEICVDTAFENGKWRHPIRLVRVRDDMTPGDMPAFAVEDYTRIKHVMTNYDA